MFLVCLALGIFNNPNWFIYFKLLPLSCRIFFFISPRENLSIVLICSQIICSSVQIFSVQFIFYANSLAFNDWFDSPNCRWSPLWHGEDFAALRIRCAIVNSRQILVEFDVFYGDKAGWSVRFDNPGRFRNRTLLLLLLWSCPPSRYFTTIILSSK